jgi:hypothetical protein
VGAFALVDRRGMNAFLFVEGLRMRGGVRGACIAFGGEELFDAFEPLCELTLAISERCSVRHVA